jgi:hypothetical protein
MPTTVSLIPRTPFSWQTNGGSTARLELRSSAVVALCFTAVPTTPQGVRLEVAMLLAGRRRPVGITAQPALAWRLVDDAAVERDVHPVQLRQRLTDHLLAFATAQGCNLPGVDGLAGIELVFALSYPLGGAALARGATALADVPRWATAALQATTPTAAAELAFGRLASRRVSRALAASLVAPESGRTVALYPMALALMGRDALDTDRVATTLGLAAPFRPAELWPDVDGIELARRTLARLGPARVGRVLADAATLPDGPRLLARTVPMLVSTAGQLPARLPFGLQALHDLAESLLAIDPAPRHSQPAAGRPHPGRGPRRTPTTHHTPDEPTDDLAAAVRRIARVFAANAAPHRPAHGGAPTREAATETPATTRRRRPPAPSSRALPPPFTAAARGEQAISYAPDIAALNGLELVGNLRLSLPRTGAELQAWGRRLRNCLGSFGADAVAGHAILIGVHRRDQIVACLELTPHRQIRQFLAAGNRRVAPRDAGVVIRALLDARVLSTDPADNGEWLQLAGW